MHKIYIRYCIKKRVIVAAEVGMSTGKKIINDIRWVNRHLMGLWSFVLEAFNFFFMDAGLLSSNISLFILSLE